MAERKALLYEVKLAADLLDSLSRTLGRVGLRVEHPSSGCATLLDDQGEQMELPLEDLRQRIKNDHDIRFQWWFTEDHDVYCRIQEKGGIRIVALGMEGCSILELAKIGVALHERFISDRTGSIGFVFDPEGVTEDYDWDRFFIQKETLDWSAIGCDLPEVLGVQKPDLARMVNLAESVAMVDDGTFVVIRS